MMIRKIFPFSILIMYQQLWWPLLCYCYCHPYRAAGMIVVKQLAVEGSLLLFQTKNAASQMYILTPCRPHPGGTRMRNAHDMTHFPFANSLKSLNFKNMNTLIRATKGENVPKGEKLQPKKRVRKS